MGYQLCQQSTKTLVTALDLLSLNSHTGDMDNQRKYEVTSNKPGNYSIIGIASNVPADYVLYQLGSLGVDYRTAADSVKSAGQPNETVTHSDKNGKPVLSRNNRTGAIWMTI